ncbi:hypothetical protein Tcan_09344 [Toxocara canis]|uniref:Uncharacterized protein n=1 Tax=Toxocara canis TaxID=6265 RepID=A0A0B2V050_TOXCA|nr:hypothetical protein Tcan_09344 [Toxocara canis]
MTCRGVKHYGTGCTLPTAMHHEQHLHEHVQTAQHSQLHMNQTAQQLQPDASDTNFQELTSGYQSSARDTKPVPSIALHLHQYAALITIKLG